jgi:hypothetical protein
MRARAGALGRPQQLPQKYKPPQAELLRQAAPGQLEEKEVASLHPQRHLRQALGRLRAPRGRWPVLRRPTASKEGHATRGAWRGDVRAEGPNFLQKQHTRTVGVPCAVLEARSSRLFAAEAARIA